VVFPESELTRDIPQFRKDRAQMEDGLLWLEQKRAIRRQQEPERPRGTRGRKPAPIWEVHPALRTSENSDNSDISENSLLQARFEDCEDDNSPNSPKSPNSPELTGEKESDQKRHVAAGVREVFEL
jgi:hypothetical protein